MTSVFVHVMKANDKRSLKVRVLGPTGVLLRSSVYFEMLYFVHVSCVVENVHLSTFLCVLLCNGGKNLDNRRCFLN